MFQNRSLNAATRLRARVPFLPAALTLMLATLGANTATAGSVAQGAVSGDFRTIVLLANFKDKPLSCSAASMKDAIFTDPNGRSISALIRDTSQGRASLSGQVLGAYDLPVSSADPCDLGAWMTALDAKALAQGVDPNTFDRKVYVTPWSSTCTAGGTADAWAAVPWAWVMNCDRTDGIAHELGHTLRLGHAATPQGEYGDTSDIMGMGGSGLRGFNAPHYEDLGWRSSAMIKTVTASGRYDIAPLIIAESDAVAPQILKIAKPDTGEYYYLSYRRALGFDANLSSTYAEKVNVHKDYALSNRTYFLAGLADAQVFEDTTNAVKVSVVSRSPTYATVEVTIGNGTASCARGAPALSISPASQGGSPGQALTYYVNVSNTDSASCPASSFAMRTSSALPSGWSSLMSPTSLSLAPGAAGRVAVTLTSATSAPAGSYSFAVSSADTATAVHSGTVSGVYQVGASCVSNVPTVSVSPATQQGAAGQSLSYTLSITNNDTTGCASSTFTLSRAVPTGWSSSVSQSSVTLTPGQSVSGIGLQVTSSTTSAAGSYGLQVSVADAVRNTKGSATYVVPAPPVTDTIAPSVPAGVTAAVDAKRRRVTVSWSASTDNVAVTSYRVWRDGAVIGEGTGTWYLDASVTAGSSHSYYVTARDGAGNESAPSASVFATIPAKASGKR
jgi:hypothetical protein